MLLSYTKTVPGKSILAGDKMVKYFQTVVYQKQAGVISLSKQWDLLSVVSRSNRIPIMMSIGESKRGI